MGGPTRPLYDEQIKKGMVRIKVAFNVWIQKSKWVWLETHPELLDSYDPKRDVFIFLDGDKRNFDPHNIEKVPRSILGVINCCLGGIPAGSDPADTLLKIAHAKLKRATLDACEKTGDVYYYEHSKTHRTYRASRSYRNVYAKKYRKSLTEEERERRRKIQAERQLKHYKNLTPEQREQLRKKRREWYHKRMKDPEYRAKCCAYNKAYRERVKKALEENKNKR